MLKRTLFILLAVLIAQCTPKGQKLNTNSMYKNFNFEEAWKQVEKLENKRLFKSAAKEVMQIYKAAKSLGEQPQRIKALFYRGKYSDFLEEDNLVHFEDILRNEIAESSLPERAILQSILGEFYDLYLERHLWQIRDRTETPDTTGWDIQTWPIGRFIRESNKLFLASISDSGLKEVSYRDYRLIFIKAENTEKMRDNLFEILAYRALHHFKNDRNYLPSSKSAFVLNSPALFALPSRFAGMKWPAADQEDLKHRTIQLFQAIEKHNLDTEDEDELVDVALMRLKWVRQHYIKPDKDKWYLQALDALIKKYPGSPSIAEVWYEKALLQKEGLPGQNTDKWRLKKARDICNRVIKDYPGTTGAAHCRALVYQLERPSLDVSLEEVYIPGEHLLTSLSYKNIPKVYFKLMRVDEAKYRNRRRDGDYKSWVLDISTDYRQWEQTLPDDGDLASHRVELDISPLTTGIYLLITSSDKHFKSTKTETIYKLFHVSPLACFTREDHGAHKVFVVDRKTGAPIEGAQVQLRNFSYRDRKTTRVYTQHTNREGIALFSKVKAGNYRMFIDHGEDYLLQPANIYHSDHRPFRGRDKIVFFSDRDLYRPGQVLYFKGLMIPKDSDGMPSIDQDRKQMTIVLKDANYQVVSEQTLPVNEYGTFNGSFVLPSGGLNGQMHLETYDFEGYYSFQVESYRRPKFEVKIDTLESTYRLGDTVLLGGLASAYSGFPIGGATVRYVVKRRVRYPYYIYYSPFFRPLPGNGKRVEIAHGTTQTDEAGHFIVPVELFTGDVDIEGESVVFDYDVHVDVIAPSGETHSATTSLRAGTSKFLLTLETPKEVRVDQPVTLKIEATNYSGVKVAATGSIRILAVTPPDKIFRSRYWALPDTTIYDAAKFHALFPSYPFKEEDQPHHWKVNKEVKSLPFHTKEKEKYEVSLPAGTYKVEVSFEDTGGKKRTLERYVTVYSSSKNPPQTPLLVEADQEKYPVPSEAKVHFQTQLPLSVYTGFWRRNRLLMSEMLMHPEPSLDKTIKIIEEHRGGVAVLSEYVYDGRFYRVRKTLEVPWTNKQLRFEVEQLRSAIRPGEEVQWQLKVLPVEGQAKPAEIVAALYDKSLDAIYRREWQKGIAFPHVIADEARAFGFHTSREEFRDYSEYQGYDGSNFRKIYRDINWFGFRVGGQEVMIRSASSEVFKSAPMGKRMMKDAVFIGLQVNTNDDDEVDEIEDEGGVEKEPPALRTNLRETVFFYPEIHTEKNGSFTLRFKMNDALTKWKLRLFAHTKDLKTGYYEYEIATRKELMITPNNPRFVREGDRMVFHARVDNLTENALSGEARIEFFNAETMQPVARVLSGSPVMRAFQLEAKGSEDVSWELQFPAGIPSLLVYRVYAKAGHFTDAEEGYLPVLVNRKLVTETLPLWVPGHAKKQFTLESLAHSQGKPYRQVRLTVDAMSNPVWLAIQSLSYLRKKDPENAISRANALFANLLAGKIVADNPRIKRVFEVWSRGATKMDKEALMSRLETHQELKQVLLDETPWVLDAKDEAEQKRNLALLFDLNRMRQEKAHYMRLLGQIQNADGGFPWYPDGKSSRYITQYVLETLGRLMELGIDFKGRNMRRILTQALAFVNRDMVKRYEHLKLLQKQGKINMSLNHLGALEIHYLYMINFMEGYYRPNTVGEAMDYYLGQAKKYWKGRPLYLEGMLALILRSNGEEEVAKDIMKAAEESSIRSEELGMYWKSYHGYHWYQYPIETQAMMIEAFEQVLPDPEIVDALKIWLLKNKQTNRWRTGKATVAAVYALLSGDKEVLAQSPPIQVVVGGEDITPKPGSDALQAGTGYYRHVWPGEKVHPKMAQIQLTNPNAHIAWGGVYWQYLADLDDIEAVEQGPLKVRRTLFLVRDTDKGQEMSPIAEGQKLHPGDLVRVQMRVQIDREMEFVHLSDQRAACLEPIEQISGYRWEGGLGYYQSPKDSKTHFFIDFLPRGVYTFDYDLRVMQSGTFSNGIAELQSYYAPEFSSHSAGKKVVVE